MDEVEIRNKKNRKVLKIRKKKDEWKKIIKLNG